MLRKIALIVPVLLLFAGTSLVFLAAHAPRTWAAHWTAPKPVARGAGQNEYGAVPDGAGWDILWVDDDRAQLVLTRGAGSRRSRATVLDRGEVGQPSLVAVGGRETAVWVHDHNGSTDLMSAIIPPARRPLVSRLVTGPWPLEHPNAFTGPHGIVQVVFSWQRYGNFDLFLLSLHPGAPRPVYLHRLTHSRIYGFYPRAITAANGVIYVLHLESCCHQQQWDVVLNRYDTSGRQIGSTKLLSKLVAPYELGYLPSAWAEDIRIGPGGRIWGAYAGDAGIWVFELDRSGRGVARKRLLDPLSGIPDSLALTIGPAGGRLMWEQSFDLGRYLTGQRFSPDLTTVTPPERAVYEAGSQTGIHAVDDGTTTRVLWQVVGSQSRSTFQTSVSVRRVVPSLAQRFGLGLANPWGTLGVLLIVAIGVAAITTMGNILTIFGYGLAGFVLLRVIPRSPVRWTIFALVLAAGLFLTFVSPGGPILFLGTMPSMGFPIAPFGLIAATAVLLLALWVGDIALRHVEDLYRVGALVALGVYFFAYVEAIVFVQQRLGYI